MYQKLMAVVLLFAAGALSGCAGPGMVGSKMESSKAAYTRCLAENPDNPERCAALRDAYEADVRAFRSVSTGLTRKGVLSPD